MLTARQIILANLNPKILQIGDSESNIPLSWLNLYLKK